MSMQFIGVILVVVGAALFFMGWAQCVMMGECQEDLPLKGAESAADPHGINQVSALIAVDNQDGQ